MTSLENVTSSSDLGLSPGSNLKYEICTGEVEGRETPARILRVSDSLRKDVHVDISFHSTLRVPLNKDAHLLPPDFGHLPLECVEEYQRLPSAIRSNGGLFFPMHENQAMFIQIEFHDLPMAVNLFWGGKSIISGRTIEERPDRGDHLAVTGRDRHWIDGIPISKPRRVYGRPQEAWGSSSLVQQFVAGANTKLIDKGQWFEDLEEQLCLELVPLHSFSDKLFKIYLKFPWRKSTFKTTVSLATTVSLLRKEARDLISENVDHLHLRYKGHSLLDCYPIGLYGITSGATIEVFELIEPLFYKSPGSYLNKYIGRFRSQKMKIVPGGLISQRFRRSIMSPVHWDRSRAIRINCTPVSTRQYFGATAKSAPPPPMDADTYEKNSLPFFQDDYALALSLKEKVKSKTAEEDAAYTQYLGSLGDAQVVEESRTFRAVPITERSHTRQSNPIQELRARLSRLGRSEIMDEPVPESLFKTILPNIPPSLVFREYVDGSGSYNDIGKE